MESLKEVSKEVFYDVVMNQDAVLNTTGSYPYTTEYRLRSGLLLGKSVDSEAPIESEELIITKHYLLKATSI